MSPPLPCGIPVLADAGGGGGCAARVAAGGAGGGGGCTARVAAGGAGRGGGCTARVAADAGDGVDFAARVAADAGGGVGFAARVVTEGAVGCGLLVADELAADPLLGLPLDEPPQPATASTIPAAANNAGSATRTFLIRVLISIPSLVDASPCWTVALGNPNGPGEKLVPGKTPPHAKTFHSSASSAAVSSPETTTYGAA